MVIWNLENIYVTENEQKLIDELHQKTDLFISKKETLKPTISSSELINLFELEEQIILISSKLSTKTGLKNCEDVLNKEILKKLQSIELDLTNLSNNLIFFTHFIKDLDEENAKRLESNLGRFTYYFKDIRRSLPHSRTLEEEKIINLKDLSGESVLETLRSIITGKFSFMWDEEKINEAQLSVKATDSSPEVRMKAYDLLLNKYKETSDEIGEIYKGVSLDWFNEQVNIRKHSTSISARNFSNTLSDETVQILLKTVRNSRKIFQKYFQLKSKILNIPNSRYHVYAPYKIESKKYSFEESKQIVLETFKEFSEEMYDLANLIFEKGNVHSDILPSKRGGAFCTYYDKDAVPYILLNHTDDLNSLLTMAHEFGHGVHGQLAKDKTQMTYHSATALAETASIFAEMLLTEKLKKNATKEEKIYLLIHHLDGLFASILRQVYFVLFEEKAHDLVSKGVGTDELNNLYFDLLKEQFGEEMEIPEIFKYEWLRIPHIFELPFYCYSYSFGNLLVLALYQKYKEEGDSFIPKYLEILKAGGDNTIEDILLSSNINPNSEEFWNSAISKIEEDIKELNSLINN